MIPQPKEIENIKQKISALEQKIDDINKDNIYKMFLNVSKNCEDLNNVRTPSIVIYDPNTLNSPYKQLSGISAYGTVITIANSTNTAYVGLWVYQIALAGNKLYIRSQTNQQAWQKWNTIQIN